MRIPHTVRRIVGVGWPGLAAAAAAFVGVAVLFPPALARLGTRCFGIGWGCDLSAAVYAIAVAAAWTIPLLAAGGIAVWRRLSIAAAGITLGVGLVLSTVAAHVTWRHYDHTTGPSGPHVITAQVELEALLEHLTVLTTTGTPVGDAVAATEAEAVVCRYRDHSPSARARVNGVGHTWHATDSDAAELRELASSLHSAGWDATTETVEDGVVLLASPAGQPYAVQLSVRTGNVNQGVHVWAWSPCLPTG